MLESRLDDWVLLSPKESRLDARRAPALRLALRQALELTGRVLLDLRRVRRLDPSAAAALLDAARGALGRGELRLFGLHAQVRATLRATGLDALLDLYEDLPAALARTLPSPASAPPEGDP